MHDDLPLKPLQASHEDNGLEADLKRILIDLYDANIRALDDEINVYGMPHLGPFGLIERLVTADGLVLIRQGDEAGLRYLWKAWRHLNPERGLHFLRTYLQVLWPDAAEVNQLWQKKSEPYPNALKTDGELTYSTDSPDDYFLTSRILVDLDTDIIPDRIIKALRSAIAARFLLKMRIAKFSLNTLAVGGIAYNVQIMKVSGTVKDIPIMASNGTPTIGQTAGAALLMRVKGEAVAPNPG